MSNLNAQENFRRNVADKYTIYNSLFAALPFSGVANAGNLLPILLQKCVDGYAAQKSPTQIIDEFFDQQTQSLSESDRLDSLFKFVQFIERQVVLFDAIEDAAFPTVNDTDGAGTMRALLNEAIFANKKDVLRQKLHNFRIRVVLTAHPTQFYPGNVLGIIHDMAKAIERNEFHSINQYIQQLGITPFFNKQQPTPYDEALNLMWYLENVFYHAVGQIYHFIDKEIFDGDYEGANPFIELGFWPGGDRDGNPFVDAATTQNVAEALRSAIIFCYYRDVKRLKRRLTFRGVDKLIAELEQLLYENVFLKQNSQQLTTEFLCHKLDEIRQIIINDKHTLYLNRLEDLMHRMKIFGTHFATLDVRQDSRIHHKVLQNIHQKLVETGESGIFSPDYERFSTAQKIACLGKVSNQLDPNIFDEKIVKDTLESIYAIQKIQQNNGEKGCHRYIISNCGSAENVMEVYALFLLCGWQNPISVDIMPLFETIDDLKEAEQSMQNLYADPIYKTHLTHRNNHQSVMLGFSDGTKDGGYLQANWSIYEAKERLTAVSRKHDIIVKFFDGRGGPPSRGGGKTHKFYASMGDKIENEEIQLTIQGQTITSNFGTIVSAKYNLEQLLSAGLRNEVFAESKPQLSDAQSALLTELSERSYQAYQAFKANPKFLKYLEKISPMNFYGRSNIASRPTKRSGGGELKFEDLRAIPFVGAWSQLKQNVPGFYGMGTAFQQLSDENRFEEIKKLFQNVTFFRALIENSMMSMQKSFFALTRYVAQDPEFGDFWKQIEAEYELSKHWVLRLADATTLMEDEKVGRQSIVLRDQIVLPLLTIQQYGLQKLHSLQAQNAPAAELEVYEKLITRSMFGIINAGRNAV